jgi:hypothetical protein
MRNLAVKLFARIISTLEEGRRATGRVLNPRLK